MVQIIHSCPVLLFRHRFHLEHNPSGECWVCCLRIILCIIWKHLKVFYPVINLVFNVLFPECFCPSYQSKFTFFCDFDSIIFEELCADCIRVLSFIMRMVFVGFVQYPKSGPLACRYSHHFFTPASDPTADLSSAYHTCFTSSFAVSLLCACINAHVDKAYISIAVLSPCITPMLPGGCHLNLLNRVTKNCSILLKTISLLFS